MAQYFKCPQCTQVLLIYGECAPSNGYKYQRPETKVPEHKAPDGKRCKNSRKPLPREYIDD